MFDPMIAINQVAGRLADRDFFGAVEVAEEAIAKYPESGALYELAGLAWDSLGDLDNAISCLESATSLKPLSTVAQLRLATGYFKKGHFQTARAVAEFLLSRFYEGKLELAATSQLVLCLAELKLYREASNICLFTCSQNPEDGDAAYGVAWYRFLAGDDIRSELFWLERAVEFAAYSERYRITLGRVYADLCDFRSAVDTFLSLNPMQIQNVRCPCCLAEMIEFLCLHDCPNSAVVLQMRRQLQTICNQTADSGD